MQVWHDTHQGVIEVALGTRHDAVTVHPREVGTAVLRQTAAIREALETRYSQWRYFNRGLRMFTRDRVYLFKPMQRFHWMESQAFLDAGEVIGLVLDRRREAP